MQRRTRPSARRSCVSVGTAITEGTARRLDRPNSACLTVEYCTAAPAKYPSRRRVRLHSRRILDRRQITARLGDLQSQFGFCIQSSTEVGIIFVVVPPTYGFSPQIYRKSEISNKSFLERYDNDITCTNICSLSAITNLNNISFNAEHETVCS